MPNEKSKEKYVLGDFAQWLLKNERVPIASNSSNYANYLQQQGNICSYIYWANQAKLPLEYYNMPTDPVEKEKKKREILLMCDLTQDTKLYKAMYGSNITSKIISHDFIYEKLIPYLEKLRNQSIDTIKSE